MGKYVALLVGAALGAGITLAVQHFRASGKTKTPVEKQDPFASLEELTRELGEFLQESQRREQPDDAEVRRFLDAILQTLPHYVTDAELNRLREARAAGDMGELRRLYLRFRAAEEAERRRLEYMKSCVGMLEKILRLAQEGDLPYLPRPFRAELRASLDSDDYYEVCRAFGAVIAAGVVARAYELEPDRWRGNLDEHWNRLVDRVKEATERYKRAGNEPVVLPRPHSLY